MTTVTCAECGKSFERDTHKAKRSKNNFCNNQCYSAYNRGGNSPLYKGGKYEHVCETCGTTFENYQKTQKCCSIKCSAVNRRVDWVKRGCTNCKKEFGVVPSAAKWAKIRGNKESFCSPKCKYEYYRGAAAPSFKTGKNTNERGYVRLTTTDEKDGKQTNYEHVSVMEKHLGRRLTKDECVHHINHVRHDNRIENLELMAKSDHARLHLKKRIKDGTLFLDKDGNKIVHGRDEKTGRFVS